MSVFTEISSLWAFPLMLLLCVGVPLALLGLIIWLAVRRPSPPR